MTRSTLLVAVTHFHNASEVRAFVDHVLTLPRPAGLDVHVGICDNSGDWPDGEAVPDAAFLVRPDANAGYMGGARRVFERWTDRHGLPTWLAICNTDLTLADDALEVLTGQGHGASVIAPGIVRADGTAQNPFLERRYSTLRAYAYVWITRFSFTLALLARSSKARRRLGRLRPRRRAADRAASGATGTGASRHVYAPHGSCVFVGRRFFEGGGSLAFGGFMYGEEIHVAEQARLADCPVVFVPALQVRHDEHSVTAGVGDGARRSWLHESAVHVWRRYFAPGWWPGASPTRGTR
jgi:hypothetical protein